MFTEREQGIIQVRSPLPFPLKWVNGYLISDSNGWVLIDPGLHTTESEQNWQETLAQLSIRPSDIHSIVLTHHHPDHYGLAGWMQQWTGAPVYMADNGYAQTQRMWGEGNAQNTSTLLDFYRLNGLPESLEEAMHTHVLEFVALVSPQPIVSSLQPGQTIYLGDEPYEVLEGSGHAYGHLLFYQKHEGRMFCGDHVMPHISPNVSYLPGVDENPLQSYLTSLAQLQSLPVRLAYPGHRDPFINWSERISQLLSHHAQRLDWFVERLSERMTAFDCCRALFGDRLSIHQLRFALSETLAHLIFLEKERKIKKCEEHRIEYQQQEETT